MENAKRLVLAAWNAFNPRGEVQSNIGVDQVAIAWRIISGRLDTGTRDKGEFTGDQDALIRWGEEFGEEYSILPAAG